MISNIIFDYNPENIDIQYIKDELRNYNSKIAGDYNSKPFNVLLTDNNEIIGGLLGTTYWGWLHIDKFWIHKNHRNCGLGSELLKFAENKIYDDNCRYIHLFTHNIKAINFYIRNGYKIIYEFEKSSNGMIRYLITKKIIKNQKVEFLDQYKINLCPDKNELRFITDELDSYVNDVFGKKLEKYINVIVKNEKNEIIGGFLSGIVNDWSYIENIWIKDDYRNYGLGKKLIEIFEKKAIINHCKYTQLFSYTFQNMRFFTRIGYKTKCKLKNLPKEYSKCLMIKIL